MHISVPVLIVLIAALLVAIIVAAFMAGRLTLAKKKQQQAEVGVKQLEHAINTLKLETLESRLSPHLFKNILNSIQSHAYQTYFALDKLANVLDYILYESKKGMVTPRQEIEFARDLIEINKIKISPLFELKIKNNIDESLALYDSAVMAPLITVDLIENAFKHADLQSADSFISIVFDFDDTFFSLTVSNKVSPRTPFKKHNSGVGAETLQQRLQIIYKDQFTLNRYVESDVYVAQLKIKLIEQENKMHLN